MKNLKDKEHSFFNNGDSFFNNGDSFFSNKDGFFSNEDGFFSNEHSMLSEAALDQVSGGADRVFGARYDKIVDKTTVLLDGSKIADKDAASIGTLVSKKED